MIRSLTLALSLILPLATACPALTQTAARQTTVSTTGLDLDSPAGATTFLHRLDAAVTRVCGPAPDIRDLERDAAFNACRAQAKAGAIARLNNAEVSAIAGVQPKT
jgi:UrcA family protein